MSANNDHVINYEALKAPFPVESITWKPQAVSKDKSRAMAVPYADLRAYEDRLNAVVGDLWQSKAEFIVAGDRLVCVVHLSINGLTRAGDGESPLSDDNAATSAYAQAFKRACSRFGLGRYLYDLPTVWVDYDPQRKAITEEARRQLEGIYRRYLETGQADVPTPQKPRRGNDGKGQNGNGEVKIPPVSEEATRRARAVELSFGKHKGKTLGEVFDAEPDYVRWLSENAQSPKLRAAAGYLMQLRQGQEPEQAEAGGQEPNGDGQAEDGDGGPGAVVVPFGKFRGKTLAEIAKIEPSYIIWLANNAKTPKVQQAAAALIEAVAESQEEGEK